LKKSRLIDETLAFNVKSFNAAILRSKSEFNGLYIERFDGSNATGVFRLTYQKCKFYYITNESLQVQYPKPLDANWKAAVLNAAKDVLEVRATRSNSNAETTCPAIMIVSAANERNRQMICTSTRDKARTLLCNKHQNTGSTEQSSSLTSTVSTISIGASLNTHDGSTTPSLTQDEQDVRNAQAKMHATCSVLHLNDPGMM
jgi:hypothetical protein